jgi:hypothetical protein
MAGMVSCSATQPGPLGFSLQYQGGSSQFPAEQRVFDELLGLRSSRRTEYGTINAELSPRLAHQGTTAVRVQIDAVLGFSPASLQA